MIPAFVNLVAASLRAEWFTLVDIGCSGGLEPVWRGFGDRFRAVGFDASIEECRRLTAEEKQPNIHYIAGFVRIQPDHPLAERTRGQPPLSRNFFTRTSAARMMELRREHLERASLHERLQHNAWSMTELADRNNPVIVPDALRSKQFSDVDLVKMDIDSDDFLVLNSLDGVLDELRVAAARLEVNLFGDPSETTHTFHNTDRFMRQRGFDLAALDSRSYSMRALPARFAITMPAQTETGRVFQADAYYVRDVASTEFAGAAAALSDEKLAKLAAILSVWRQPDGAAEILLKFRSRLASLFDVDAALDLLAAQAQPGVEQPLSYKEYIDKFESDSADFYPKPWTPPPPITLKRRIAAALRAFRDPNNPPQV